MKTLITILGLLIFVNSGFSQTTEKFLKLVSIVAKDTSLSCTFSGGGTSCAPGISSPHNYYSYTVPTGRVAKVVNLFTSVTGAYIYVYINNRRIFVDRAGSECGNCRILESSKNYDPIWLKSGDVLRFDFYRYSGDGTLDMRLVAHEFVLE